MQTKKVPPYSLKLKFSGGIIETLGLRQNGGFVPALAELVANAWDADATEVDIRIPFKTVDKNSMILVKDNGTGMSFDECQNSFLTVGLNRRKAKKSDRSQTLKRLVMGRKGIGKFAGFGIADIIEVQTTKDNLENSFSLDLNEMELSEFSKLYLPKHIKYNEKTGSQNGTTIILKNLRTSRRPNEKRFETSMTNRFGVLTSNFVIKINGIQLTQEILEIVYPNAKRELKKEKIPNFGEIEFWIGFTKTPMNNHVLNGVSVYAHGKIAQESFYFQQAGSMGSQFGLHYLTGQIFADALDKDKDLISTNRRSVLWDEEPAVYLFEWGQKKIQNLCKEFISWRVKSNIEGYPKTKKIQAQISELPTTTKKQVKEEISHVVEMEQLSKKATKSIIDSMIRIGESTDDGLDKLEKRIKSKVVSRKDSFFKFVQDQNAEEKRYLARIANLRLEIIKKFTEMLNKGRLKIDEIQIFLSENPWLLYSNFLISTHNKELDEQIQKSLHFSPSSNIIYQTIQFGSWYIVNLIVYQGLAVAKNLKELDLYINGLNNILKNEKNMHDKLTLVQGVITCFKTSVEVKFELENYGRQSIQTWDELQVSAKKVYQSLL